MAESEKRNVSVSHKEDYITIRSIESGTIYKRTDGILILRQLPDRDTVTLKELQDQLVVFLAIQNGELSPLIVVVDRLAKLENEEKMFLSSTVTQFANKICIVTDTPLPTFIFNIFLFLTRPSIPAKIFKTEKEALKWAKES
jgi:hypothetical protein